MYNHDSTNWNFEQQLVVSDSTTGEVFETSVYIRGKDTIISALQKLSFGASAIDPGKAYMIYNNGTPWIENEL